MNIWLTVQAVTFIADGTSYKNLHSVITNGWQPVINYGYSPFNMTITSNNNDENINVHPVLHKLKKHMATSQRYRHNRNNKLNSCRSSMRIASNFSSISVKPRSEVFENKYQTAQQAYDYLYLIQSLANISYFENLRKKKIIHDSEYAKINTTLSQFPEEQGILNKRCKPSSYSSAIKPSLLARHDSSRNNFILQPEANFERHRAMYEPRHATQGHQAKVNIKQQFKGFKSELPQTQAVGIMDNKNVHVRIYDSRKQNSPLNEHKLFHPVYQYYDSRFVIPQRTSLDTLYLSGTLEPKHIPQRTLKIKKNIQIKNNSSQLQNDQNKDPLEKYLLEIKLKKNSTLTNINTTLQVRPHIPRESRIFKKTLTFGNNQVNEKINNNSKNNLTTANNTKSTLKQSNKNGPFENISSEHINIQEFLLPHRLIKVDRQHVKYNTEDIRQREVNKKEKMNYRSQQHLGSKAVKSTFLTPENSFETEIIHPDLSNDLANDKIRKHILTNSFNDIMKSENFYLQKPNKIDLITEIPLQKHVSSEILTTIPLIQNQSIKLYIPITQTGQLGAILKNSAIIVNNQDLLVNNITLPREDHRMYDNISQFNEQEINFRKESNHYHLNDLKDFVKYSRKQSESSQRAKHSSHNATVNDINNPSHTLHIHNSKVLPLQNKTNKYTSNDVKTFQNYSRSNPNLSFQQLHKSIPLEYLFNNTELVYTGMKFETNPVLFTRSNEGITTMTTDSNTNIVASSGFPRRLRYIRFANTTRPRFSIKEYTRKVESKYKFEEATITETEQKYYKQKNYDVHSAANYYSIQRYKNKSQDSHRTSSTTKTPTLHKTVILNSEKINKFMQNKRTKFKNYNGSNNIEILSNLYKNKNNINITENKLGNKWFSVENRHSVMKKRFKTLQSVNDKINASTLSLSTSDYLNQSTPSTTISLMEITKKNLMNKPLEEILYTKSYEIIKPNHEIVTNKYISKELISDKSMVMQLETSTSRPEKKISIPPHLLSAEEVLAKASQSVADLTSSASALYKKPGMFKLVPPFLENRTIKVNFIIPPDTPSLPIEKFFQEHQKETKVNKQ